MLVTTLSSALLFMSLILGLYISYRLLKIPDLGCDASFLMGAALFAVFRVKGVSFSTACLISVLGGALIGASSAYIQIKLKLNPLIAGILVFFVYQSLIYKIMGKPNILLPIGSSIFDKIPELYVLIFQALGLVLGLGCLLNLRFGLLLQASGIHAALLKQMGTNAEVLKLLGLMMSNGLVAFCGALNTEVNRFADFGMSQGVIMIALAMVLLGAQIKKMLFKSHKQNHFYEILSLFLGALLYFFTQNLFVQMGFDLIYLKMLIGASLIAFLGFSNQSERLVRAM